MSRTMILPSAVTAKSTVKVSRLPRKVKVYIIAKSCRLNIGKVVKRKAYSADTPVNGVEMLDEF